MRFPAVYRMKIVIFSVVPLTMLLAGSGQGAYLDRELKEAREMAMKKDFEGALEMYDFILEEDPENIEALNGRGRVLSWIGRYEDSRSTYREILRLDPGNLDSKTGIADTFALELDYERAIHLMERERVQNPGDKEILIRLARYNLRAGNRDEALYYSRKILENNPRDRDALDIKKKTAALYNYETYFGYYFLDINNDDNGHNLYGGLRYRPNNSYTLFGRLDLLDRFDETEGRFAGGGTIKLREKLQFSSEVGIAPGAEVYPIVSGWVELASLALSSWVIYGSLNYSHYEVADLYGFSIAGEYFPYGYVSILSRFTLSKIEFDSAGSSTDVAFLLKATWHIDNGNNIFAYFEYGNEAFKANTIDRVGDIEAKVLGVGGTYFFKPGWGISPSFEYFDREVDTRYVQIGLELKYRW